MSLTHRSAKNPFPHPRSIKNVHEYFSSECSPLWTSALLDVSLTSSIQCSDSDGWWTGMASITPIIPTCCVNPVQPREPQKRRLDKLTIKAVAVDNNDIIHAFTHITTLAPLIFLVLLTNSTRNTYLLCQALLSRQ